MYKINQEYIIHCLQSYYNITKSIPKKSLTAQQLGVAPATIRKKFGSWNNALNAAKIPCRVKSESIITICLCCKQKIHKVLSQFNRSDNHFCSSSCAAKHNNTGKTHSLLTKEKISKSIKSLPPKIKKTHKLYCRYCNNLFESKSKRRKTCSNDCKKLLMSQFMTAWLTSNRKHIKGSHQQSYLERSFEQWLRNNNINYGLSGYLTEIHFVNKITHKNGWIDFLFPKLQLIIELDGSHHTKRKELDKTRDQYLINKGWNVMRITHQEYQKQSRIDEIKTLLKIN